MSRHLFKFVNRLNIRWKMLVVVLPLVLVPIFIVGTVVGWIGYRQAHLGITQTSMDDLDHLADFSVDLLDAHHRQFQVYQEDKKTTVREDLEALVTLTWGMIEAQQEQIEAGVIELDTAQESIRRAMKIVQVGESGYLYAMNTAGHLTVHIAREGENIAETQDENGRYFIRTMTEAARRSQTGEVLTIIYPWRNEALGDLRPRRKMAVYRYYEPWDWIIAAGGYLDETYEDPQVERKAFAELKEKIKAKKVGETGYIYCMDRKGNLTIHPESEGENIYEARDSDGTPFIQVMTKQREGWIRYPWQNPGENHPRRKIVRYLYFQPWDWIVAVGSYEDEFYQEAHLIKGRILASLSVISLAAALVASFFVFLAAKVLSDPIKHMIDVIRDIKAGHFKRQMQVDSRDELGELAATFNRLTRVLRRNRELETNLARQGKMASLGVLSSGVAHEINNPLGVIMGYAGYLEKKLDPEDPNYTFIHEIKRESKRCKKIVQDLLNYARTPQPKFTETNIHQLLDQILDFAANHTDLHGVKILKDFQAASARIPADGDQIRQVAINLVLNAGAAMPEGGRLTVRTESREDCLAIAFIDTGCGIDDDDLERIFEPFYTTREKGTGLGLAITKQIIDQHQGTIRMDSEPGQGTTVTICLPLSREEI